VIRKSKHKVPPTYVRAEDGARPFYGRRDDSGFGWVSDTAEIGKASPPLITTDATDRSKKTLPRDLADSRGSGRRVIGRSKNQVINWRLGIFSLSRLELGMDGGGTPQWVNE
jgi:hypothetical protein